MRSMKYEAYTSKFFELLRYLPYITNEKAKVKRFVSDSPLEFRDWVEYDKPQSLEELIRD